MNAHVRPESPADVPQVRRVLEESFAQPQEATLVDALRGQVEPWVSLVAEAEGQVVGHILFTPVTVTEGGASWSAVALGPMAVAPSHQRQGIGSQLVRAGLDTCRALGEELVFVLGHPEYYPRFGFAPALPRGLSCKWPVPAEVFMVCELCPGALDGRSGLVHYHPAFDLV